jgi:hypothetical protein
MATLTVKINERSSIGKAIADFLRSTAKESKVVKLIEKEEKSPYNPEFVEKVLQADKYDKRYRIDTDKLWETIESM